jgi:hypothetical protein
MRDRWRCILPLIAKELGTTILLAQAKFNKATAGVTPVSLAVKL